MSRFIAPLVTLAATLVLTVSVAAQTGMIRGKIVDAEGKPAPGVVVTIEFADGVTRKFQVKTDRRGEFIQIGLQPGNYKITATHEKLGSQSANARVNISKPVDVNFAFTPDATGPSEADVAKANELKKIFEEGVAASKANDHDLAIEKFTAAAGLMPTCYDCYYNIGYAYTLKKDDKQAEAAWLKALELKPDYSEALNALATLYNNQKRFDEAAAMGARAASAGGTGSADAIYNQGIILWNQNQIPEAKAKFEEALKANPNHAPSHFQLGMALLNVGQTAEAIVAFEKYLSLEPEGQFAAAAKGMLAQLKK